MCLSKKGEQAINRDARAKEAAKEMATPTPQSPVHSHSLPVSPLQKKYRYQQDSFIKEINVHGA